MVLEERLIIPERVTNDEILKRVDERKNLFKTTAKGEAVRLVSTPFKLVHHPDLRNDSGQ